MAKSKRRNKKVSTLRSRTLGRLSTLQLIVVVLAVAAVGTYLLFHSMASSTPIAAPGIETDISWGISSADQATEVTNMKNLGVKWARINVTWADYEPTRGTYNSWWVNNIDTSVNETLQAGINVDLEVYTAPSWANGTSDVNAPPTNPADYATFMAYLANRYKGRVAAYEIWNEQNISRFWSTGPNPAAYANLLKAATPAVHGVDPNAKVVFGGLAANDTTFLQGVYNAGGGSYFDIMATHPYEQCGSNGDPTLDTANSSGNYPATSFLGYRNIYKTMQANSDGAKPLWFTEFGWSTTTQTCTTGGWANGVTAAQQSTYLTDAFNLMEQTPYVQVAIWYNQRNNYWDNDANTIEDQLGLETTNFTPKPAFAAFQSYAATYANTTSPSSTPSPPPPPPPPPAPALNVQLTLPTNGQTFTNSLAMSATASGPNPITKVVFYLDGRAKYTAKSAPYAFTLSTRKTSYGNHTVMASAYDSAGKVASSSSVTVTRVR